MRIASHPNILTKSKKDLLMQVLLLLVETVGIEPMTSCMSSMRSNQLSYASATDDIIAHLFSFVNRFSESFLKKTKKVFWTPNGDGNGLIGRAGMESASTGDTRRDA